VGVRGCDDDVDQLTLHRGFAAVDADHNIKRRRVEGTDPGVNVRIGAKLLDDDHLGFDPVVLGATKTHVLWARTNLHCARPLGLDRRELGSLDRDILASDAYLASLDAALKQVHLRRADEPRNKCIDWLVIHHSGGADLLEDTVLQYGNPIAHR